MLNIKLHPKNASVDDTMYQLMLMADPDIKAIKQYLTQATILLASLNQQIIGIAVLVKPTQTEQTIELKNIAIDAHHQGKGYAKQLINAAKQQALLQGASLMTVGTGNSSLPQLALYQKCGFRISHIMPDFFKSYPEPIFENGIRCIDMVMLKCELTGL